MFVFATAASFFATQLFIYTIIVRISVFETAGLSALFYALAFLPFLVFSRAIGRLTDRVDRLPVVSLTHVAIAVLFAWVSLTSGSMGEYKVVLIGAGFGALFIFIPSFRYALISDLYPKATQPSRLVTLNIISVLAVSCSPLLHLLLVSVDESLPFQFSAVLIGIATLIYLLLWKKQASLPLMRDVVSGHAPGFSVFKTNRTALLFCALGIALMGPVQSLVPGYLSAITQSDVLRDLMMPAIGLGLIGSSVILKLLSSQDRIRMSICLVFCLALIVVMLAYATTALVASLSLFLIGACAGTLVNWNQAVIQAATPAFAQGQLMSLLAAINMGIPALFSLVVGSLTLWVSVDSALLAIPAFLLVTLSVFIMRISLLSNGLNVQEHK